MYRHRTVFQQQQLEAITKKERKRQTHKQINKQANPR